MSFISRLICPLLLGAMLIAGNIQAAPVSSGEVSGFALGPSHEGIPGITITISKEGTLPQTVVSGYGGEFSFSRLDPGNYQIYAGFEGILESNKVAIVVQPGKTSRTTLSLTFQRLNETVLVRGRYETLATSELRECAAVDLGEAMMRMPGLAKVRKGAIANDIVLRALQRDNINVLIDGGRIYGACPNRMDSPAFHVDFSEIERIEVTKGPFDIENQGSLGGLVNIVTLKPESGFHLSAILAGGTAAYINPSLNISYGGKKLSGAFGFSLRSSGPYLDGAGRRFTETANYIPSQLDSRAFGIGTAWGKFYLTPRNDEKIEITYTRQQADFVFYPGLLMDSPWDNADRLGASWTRQKLTGIIENFQIHAYASRVHHWMTDELRISGLGTPRGYSMGTEADTQALGFKAKATVKGFHIGLEGARRNWNAGTMMAKMNYVAQASIPDVNSSMLGAFVSRNWDFGSDLQLHAGARIDQIRTAADSDLANTNLYFAYHASRSTSRTDTIPSASIRLTWKPTTQFEITGSGGQTVRVPDPAERYFALKRMGSDWVGNPDLLPTRNIGSELKATWHYKMGAISGTVFYQSLADWIALINKPREASQPGVINTMARSYANTAARLWGAEIEFSFALTSRLFAAGNLSWVRGEKNIDPAQHIISANLGEVPPLSTRIYFRYDSGRFYAEAEGIITSAQNQVDLDLLEEATPGWQILNLRLGTSFHNFRIQAALDNLFNRLYSEHLANARDPFRTGARVYEPGRRFVITIIYRL